MNIQQIQNQSQNYNFAPSINIFDKAIVFCYQKVGTRFFLFLSNWPKTIDEVYNQYHINFSYSDNSNNKLIVNTEFSDLIASIQFIDEHKNSCYDYDSFFQHSNTSTINEFLFNNPKDLVFVIRNPIKRFLSGLPQITGQYVCELLRTENERNKIKSLINITGAEIDNIINNYDLYFNEEDTFSDKSLSIIDINIFVKITMYIIDYNSHQIYYDAHTQNYLSKFKEFIYNIKNKNKVKIIDLDDCKKDSAFKLFNTWSDTIDYTDAKSNLTGNVISNKKLYNHLNLLLTESNDPISERIYNFLNSEIREYNELKKSKYFIKL